MNDNCPTYPKKENALYMLKNLNLKKKSEDEVTRDTRRQIRGRSFSRRRSQSQRRRTERNDVECETSQEFPLETLQYNIYIKGVAYHYELRISPNYSSKGKNSNCEFIRKHFFHRSLITNDGQSKISINEICPATSKHVNRNIKNFLNDLCDIHQYKSYYPRMPLHHHSLIANGDSTKILLESIKENRLNFMKNQLLTDHILKDNK
ncbi:hypothetical protein SNEBB_010490 [Seison nebaliae]|nr:hypothetical protein SNEBB_010490 [Seison nebaliae]